MRTKRRADGTLDLLGVPETLLKALLHAAGDLGAKNAVLRYDERVYGKYARPNKAARQELLEFSRMHDSDSDFFDFYEDLGKPKFRKSRFA